MFVYAELVGMWSTLSAPEEVKKAPPTLALVLAHLLGPAADPPLLKPYGKQWVHKALIYTTYFYPSVTTRYFY